MKSLSIAGACAILVLLVIVGVALLAMYYETDARARFWNEGFEAGLHGVPLEACPYSPTEQRRVYWLRGWAQGHKDRPATTAR